MSKKIKKVVPLTIDELSTVYKGLNGEMRMLFTVGIYTGQLLEDCAMLEWGQIDMTSGVVHIVRKHPLKGQGKKSDVPIHKTLMAALLAIPSAQRKGYVMPECAATYKRNPSEMLEKVKAALDGAGVDTSNGRIGFDLFLALMFDMTVNAAQKFYHNATVAEIPAEVTLAEVLAEVRRGFADVVDAIGKNSKAIGDVDARLESVRKILFYIPDVARGVELAKAKRAAKVASENGGKAATVAPSAGVVDVSALSPMIGHESEVTK